MKYLISLLFYCTLTISFAFSQGIVRGKITDDKGESVIGATVVLKSNRSVGTVTDFDGNFSLKLLDSNEQVLIISAIGFKEIEQSVKVQNGEVIVKSFVMTSSALEISEVQVVAKAVKSKDYYIEQIKKNSTSTIDYVSSETIKKAGDANIVSAISRVPGVSNNSAGLITVRGIGDRYIKTALNGSLIPTLDPLTNNLKLDFLPTSLVDNVIVTKTFSPELPGDWAGAYISVETKD
jgi:hypothetical protein